MTEAWDPAGLRGELGRSDEGFPVGGAAGRRLELGQRCGGPRRADPTRRATIGPGFTIARAKARDESRTRGQDKLERRDEAHLEAVAWGVLVSGAQRRAEEKGQHARRKQREDLDDALEKI